jgi:SHOCT-like domain
MDDKSENMRILEMIESGKISVEEGLGLLAALGSANEPSADETASPGAAVSLVDEAPSSPEFSEPIPPPSPVLSTTTQTSAGEPDVIVTPAPPISEDTPRAALPPDAQKWRRWWAVPLWIGVGLSVIGGALLYAAVQSTGGVNFWFFCAGVPFTLGVLAIILAWQSRTSPWLHLRVQQAPGESPQRIAISMPLPTRPLAWLLRTFGHKIPSMDGQDLDQIILAVGRNASPENPIYIQVDEGENGEKVEIYIG